MRRLISLIALTLMLSLIFASTAFAGYTQYNKAQVTTFSHWFTYRVPLNYEYTQTVDTDYRIYTDQPGLKYVVGSKIYGFIKDYAKYGASNIWPSVDGWGMDYYSSSSLALSLSRADLSGPAPDQIIPYGASPYGGSNYSKYAWLASPSVKGTTVFSVNVGYVWTDTQTMYF
ncbi:MAG: hypothetical protein M0021_11835 [Clostridia bacterium]|nr:hypothetical protein [Clostridia bacterium]